MLEDFTTKEMHSMTNQPSDFSFTVNPEAAVSIHDDGIVILHSDNGSFYTSNCTGARIWRGVERHLPLEAIVEEISCAYKIALTTAREDIVSFLAELERHTLVRREAAL
jgi:hypothetical protein